MAQQVRAVKTKQLILEAAGAVFAERGYGAATIADVYTRAGVTKGAFYFHYASKEELAEEVLSGQTERTLGFLSGSMRERAVKLQELVDSAMLLAHRLTFDKLLQGSIRLSIDQGSDLDRRPPYRSWIDFQAAVLTEAKTRGEVLPHVDVEEFAHVLVGAFSGVQLMSEVLAGRADVEARVAALYGYLIPSVAVPSVIARLDLSPDLGRRLTEEAQGQS